MKEKKSKNENSFRLLLSSLLLALRDRRQGMKNQTEGSERFLDYVNLFFHRFSRLMLR